MRAPTHDGPYLLDIDTMPKSALCLTILMHAFPVTESFSATKIPVSVSDVANDRDRRTGECSV
jgi:hypothetical protein